MHLLYMRRKRQTSDSGTAENLKLYLEESPIGCLHFRSVKMNLSRLEQRFNIALWREKELVLTVLSIVIRHLVPDVLGDVMNFRRRFGENVFLLSRPNDDVYISPLFGRRHHSFPNGGGARNFETTPCLVAVMDASS
jgi:hypothetical protein